MRRLLLRFAIACLIRVSNIALAVDGWCFDACYSLGGALINQRRRIPSQIRRGR